MNSASGPKASTEKSPWGRARVPSAGRTRLWRLVAGLFLLAGFLALLERAWTLTADWHARRTWPVANGKIVSATQQDDTDLSRRNGSIRGRTRYWVEYEVSFAVPAERCRTGLIQEGPSETMPCRGIVKTRSTQSTSDVFAWLLHGYHVNQPVKVLWDPEGASRTDIKIVGEPIWLWYNLDRLALSVAWVLGFGALYALSHHRLAYVKSHPEKQV
jgi:hypothetical protein